MKKIKYGCDTSYATCIINRVGGVGNYYVNKTNGQALSGENQGSGTFTVYNSLTGSTGDLFQFRKNGTVTSFFDHNGIMSTPAPIFTTVPVTSIGSYDFLTRNISSGLVEKLPLANVQSAVVTTAAVDATKPYKVYTALLSQSGTNAPVATVLENNLGGTIVWTRTSAGLYTGTLAGVFTANKTWTSITSTATGTVTGAVRTSVDAVTVATSSLDSALTNSAIEIRVYN